MEISIINVPYLGDLYRFYVSADGTVHEVRLYLDMATAYKLLDVDQIPDEVMKQFEHKFLS
jgi:hypothetical protein